MDKILAGLDVVFTGLSVANKHIHRAKLSEAIRFPLEVVTTDISAVREQIKERLELHTYKEIEVYKTYIDHPGIEKYVTILRYRDPVEGKMLCTVYNYPRFGMIRTLTEDSLRYTDVESTLMMLLLSGWLLERKGHAFAGSIYGVYKALRKIRTGAQGEYWGTYYPSKIWKGYDRIET